MIQTLIIVAYIIIPLSLGVFLLAMGARFFAYRLEKEQRQQDEWNDRMNQNIANLLDIDRKQKADQQSKDNT